jgi:hypothetical protein
VAEADGWAGGVWVVATISYIVGRVWPGESVPRMKSAAGLATLAVVCHLVLDLIIEERPGGEDESIDSENDPSSGNPGS